MDINLELVDEGPASSEEVDQNRESALEFDSIQLDDQKVEVVEALEENYKTGEITVNHEKSYKMTPVDGFWGVKINLNDVYYNEKASDAYQKRAKKLMR